MILFQPVGNLLMARLRLYYWLSILQLFYHLHKISYTLAQKPRLKLSNGVFSFSGCFKSESRDTSCYLFSLVHQAQVVLYSPYVDGMRLLLMCLHSWLKGSCVLQAEIQHMRNSRYGISFLLRG